MYFFSRSFCQCLLRSGNTLGKRIFLKSSMHFFRSSSSILLSSSSSSGPDGGPPFSLLAGRGSVLRLSVVGRDAVGGRNGLEVEEALDDGRGECTTRGEGGGRSGLSRMGGGGGGRGESGGGGLRTSAAMLLLFSGRLCVRPVLPGCSVSVMLSLCAVVGWDVNLVKAGGSEVVTWETTDEPPAGSQIKMWETFPTIGHFWTVNVKLKQEVN